MRALWTGRHHSYCLVNWEIILLYSTFSNWEITQLFPRNVFVMLVVPTVWSRPKAETNGWYCQNLTFLGLQCNVWCNKVRIPSTYLEKEIARVLLFLGHIAIVKKRKLAEGTNSLNGRGRRPRPWTTNQIHIYKHKSETSNFKAIILCLQTQIKSLCILFATYCKCFI